MEGSDTINPSKLKIKSPQFQPMFGWAVGDDSQFQPMLVEAMDYFIIHDDNEKTKDDFLAMTT